MTSKDREWIAAEAKRKVSEGEQHCISIAAFFAELSTADDPAAIVFDDPVSSLDFEWRSNVAKRLVEKSKRRQVIVFTHDVAFLLALKQYAEEGNIVPLDQHVRRQSKGAGVCANELPWVAIPVKGKIGHLKKCYQAAEKLNRDGNQDAYEHEAKYLYGMLREAWERALEEVFLGGVVERYRPSVQTQRLEIATKPLVMASEISGLEPLHGFIKQENRVVPVHFQFARSNPGRHQRLRPRSHSSMRPLTSPPTNPKKRLCGMSPTGLSESAGCFPPYGLNDL